SARRILGVGGVQPLTDEERLDDIFHGSRPAAPLEHVSQLMSLSGLDGVAHRPAVFPIAFGAKWVGHGRVLSKERRLPATVPCACAERMVMTMGRTRRQ